MKKETIKILKEIKSRGILLNQDKTFPSLTTIVAGEPVSGTWWSHPKSHLIYKVINEVYNSDDILVTKLINKKVTFIHKSLWDYFLVIANTDEAWKRKGLPDISKLILKRVQKEKNLLSEEIKLSKKYQGEKLGKYITDLENRLLIYSEEIHTDNGNHARVLTTWRECRFKGKDFDLKQSKNIFEDISSGLEYQFKAKVKLPWR